jgi:tetratricopeptide (TPR) repeat protein
MLRKRNLRYWLFTSALLFLTCLSAAARDDEPKWITIVSDHFTVLTDAGQKKGHETTLRFEQMRAVFAQLMMRSTVNMSVPIDIILLDNEDEYDKVAPIVNGQVIAAPAFFVSGTDRIYFVLNAAAEDNWRAISRQFALFLVNYNYPPTQAWFDEGFVEYFSSLRYDPKTKRLLIGGEPEPGELPAQLKSAADQKGNMGKSPIGVLNSSTWISIPDLFTTRRDTAADGGPRRTLFYAESWIVMDYLLSNNKLPQVGMYFGLTENQNVPVEQAVQQAFGMSAAQFEHAVKDYFKAVASATGEKGAAQTVAGAPEDIGATLQEVQVPTAQALLSEMELRLPSRRERAMKEIESLINGPHGENAIEDRALAWAYLQDNKTEEAAEDLNQAVQLNDHDPWVHYYSALVKYRTAQAKGEEISGLANMIIDMRIFIDAFPQCAAAHDMLGMGRLEGGGLNSGAEAVRIAIQLAPRNHTYLLHLAQIYQAQKKWDDANALLDRLKTDPDPKVAQGAQQALHDLPTLMKYGVPPLKAAPTENAQTASPSHSVSSDAGGSSDDDSQEAEKPQPEPVPLVPDKRPVKFAKGELVSADCAQAPDAILKIRIRGKVLRFKVEDYKNMALVGADQFSCDWKDRAVAVNYKAGATNDVVSLELE